MAGDGTVTVRLDKITKAALDIFAAKEYARTGSPLTNSQAIERLLTMVDPAVLELAKSAGDERDKPGKTK